MRRRLVIGAVTLAVVVAFAVARKHLPIARAANPPNLALVATEHGQPGCPLGPAFTFCDQVTGAPGSPGIFFVSNASAVTNVSVSIAAIPGLSGNFAAGDFTIIANTCAGNIPANQVCNLEVTFSPTTLGLRAAAMTVTDAEGDTLTINLTGTGKNLTLAPTAILGCPQDNAFTFCDQPVGGASSAEDFTLTAGAAGATGITTSFAAIPGLESEFAAADFAIETTTCTGALAANANCTVSISFTPTTAGLRSAALKATDLGGDSTTLYLAGRTTVGLGIGGVSASSLSPCAVLNSFGYCNEPSGGISSASAYTLANTSGAQITGLTIPRGSTTPNASTPPDFTVQNTTCFATLDANKTCTINVAFTPTAAGLRQGAIVVTDDQGDIAAVNLAGIGSDYNLGLASGQLKEITVAAGSKATFSLQVNPDAVFGMNGEQMTFVCPNNLPRNTSCQITPCPANVTAGTPAAFQIVIGTSSEFQLTPRPPVGTACASYSTIAFLPPDVRGPERRSPQATPPAARGWRFPAPAGKPAPRFAAEALAAILLAMGMALAFAAARSPEQRRARRMRLIAVAAGIAIAAIAGCGGGGGDTFSAATPDGATTLTIMGNALDANGNPINATRSMQIILDVTSQ